MTWWSTHSGYECLVNHLDCECVVPPQSRIARLVGGGLCNLTKPLQRLPWYPVEYFQNELAMWVRAFRYQPLVFHFIAPEADLWFCRYLRRATGQGVVATYHGPPSHLETILSEKDWRSVLSGVDAVILMSNSQRSFFEVLDPEVDIHVIPHGVDTTVFAPPDHPYTDVEERLCLTVGHWFRDFDTLRAVHRELRERWGPQLRLALVASPPKPLDPADWPGCELYSGISEEELVGLYRRASVLLMPMTDSTANNGVLEALACGVPVVASRVGGVGDYVDETCGILAPKGDVRAHTQAVSALLEAPERRRRLAEGARRRALSFSWPSIARLTSTVYDDVAGKVCSRRRLRHPRWIRQS